MVSFFFLQKIKFLSASDEYIWMYGKAVRFLSPNISFIRVWSRTILRATNFTHKNLTGEEQYTNRNIHKIWISYRRLGINNSFRKKYFFLIDCVNLYVDINLWLDCSFVTLAYYKCFVLGNEWQPSLNGKLNHFREDRWLSRLVVACVASSFVCEGVVHVQVFGMHAGTFWRR